MRTSIATVCLSGTLEEKMRAAATAGFDGVEIFEQDLIVSPSTPEDIAALAADLGITLDLYQPFRDLEGVDEARFRSNLVRASAKFELMHRLGMSTMLLCSNVGTATIDDDALVAEQLNHLGALADEHGIDIAYEALAWGRFVSEYDHAWDLVAAADHPRIGTCLDSFHILSRRTNLDRIAEIPGDRIFFLQMADAPALTMDVLSWSRHHRVFPGEGAWDLGDFLARVARTGYSGPVSLEVFNDSFRQADTDRTAADGLRSLRWLESITAEALVASSSSSTAEPGSAGSTVESAGSTALDLKPLPHVDEPTGIDFVELSTSELGALTRLLHQLGFDFTGYHRSKPHVQLWIRGQARIVVSEVQGSAAQSSTTGALAAGSSSTFLRGIGFEVTDAEASLRRAELLHAAPVPREQSHGEEVLRGVFAPDGSEVFFHQSSGDALGWIGEFGADLGRHTSHIDHINIAQPAGHYDESVLFYTSLLALHAHASQDVPSPAGLVRSQVMDSRDGSIRMPLNVSPVPLERGRGADAGAGTTTASRTAPYPEHFAITCTDIFAAAETARARGLEFLAVPENYYEDLATRFDLAPELLDRLRESSILFDADDHGTFLHFYTSTIGSVFIEMVERRDGYSGYGAPDAPVRLAAQHRLNRGF